jgi:iron complex outermembrane recepter protein
MSCAKKFKLLPLSAAVSFALYGGVVLGEESTIGKDAVIEEVTVKGYKSSLEKALSRKRDSDTIIDGIAAEDIGKFPDQNVAEALQRITGVSISRTNGEGSQVSVRGFGPEFNQVRINDRITATATSGRDFDFQVMASDLISGADVLKAPTANMSEGSIGALVNIRTARPLDNAGFQSSVSAKGRYNDLAEDFDPQFSGILSNTFNDDSMGVVLGVAYEKSNNRIDMTGGARSSAFDGRNGDVNGDPIMDVDGNPIQVTDLRFPGRQEFRIEQEERERLGINATFQWAPSDNIVNTFDVLYSDFNRQGSGFGIQAPLQSGAFSNVSATENNTLTAGTTTPQRFDMLQIDQGSDSQTYLVGFNTEAHFDTFTLKADMSYSKADAAVNRSDLVPQFGSGNGTDDRGTISFDGRDSDVLGVTTTIDVADPANVRAHWNNVQLDDIQDEVAELKLSGLKTLDFAIVESVEAGVSYTKRDKTFNHSESDGNGNCIATCGSGLDLDDSLFSVLPFDNYLSSESGDFPRKWAVITDTSAYFDALNAIKGVDAFTPIFVPRASSEVEETTTSAFFQVNFDGGDIGGMPWSGNVGLRYARTDVVSSGSAQSLIGVVRNDPNDSNTTALLVNFSDVAPETVKTNYHNFLPSANFRLGIRDDLILRLAAGQTITRPTMDALSVGRSFVTSNIESFGVTSGSPRLTPFEVTQFDASLAFYADNGSSYSIAFYYKDIETFISEATNIVDSGFNLSSNFGPVVDLSQAVTSQQNRNGGRILGIELAATHYFDYLPGWADGFGVQANYTYANSKDSNALPNDLPAVTPTSFGVEGFAENAFNLVGFYDKHGFQARFAYNWRDDFLLSRRGARSFGLPEVVASYGQLDFSASYDINDRFTVTLEGINLTNERAFISEDVPERVSLITYSGRRFILGLRASF